MPITLESARRHIGRGVVYKTPAKRAGTDPRPPEDGTIVRVGAEYVFVRYGARVMATRPFDLDYLSRRNEMLPDAGLSGTAMDDDVIEGAS